jgi:succinate dehydrogenase / fumarate reductase, cytochrome b subunit
MARAGMRNGSGDERPMSPHLQIYTLHINMLMSIVHRITGGALYFGTFILAWWLFAAATGTAYFDFVNGLLGTILGQLVLFGYTWVVLHHALGGIRHLIWDTGRGLRIPSVDLLSWGTLVGSVALTAAVWAVALHLRGIL